MDTITKEIVERSVDGKMTCKEALELAEKHGVSPSAIGKILDEKKIRIKDCQLGCFK